MTTIDEAREAIYERLQTNWTFTPFIFENEDHSTVDGGAVSWIRLSVHELPAGQETLGPIGFRKYRRRGSVIVQIFTPINEGMSEAGTLAHEIRTLFEGVSFSGLDFNNGQIRQPGPEEKWQMTICEIVFEYTEEK